MASDGYRRSGLRTYGLVHEFVVLAAELHLEDVEAVGTLACLLPYDFGGVDAYGECCRGCLLPVQTPETEPRRPEQLARKVVQGDVDGGLACGITLREGVDAGEDILRTEGVVELVEYGLRLLQEGRDALRRSQLALQVWRHRGLAVSRHAVVVDLDLYVGCRRARVCGYGEDMPQLELVWKEPQTHAGAAAAVDVEYVARSVVAGHGVEAETGACRKAGHRLEKLFFVLASFGYFMCGARVGGQKL